MRTVLLVLLGAAAACGPGAVTAPPAPAARPPAEPEPLAAEPAPAAEPEPEPGPGPRVRYDLAAHVEDAELRRGQTLVVDLGAPGGSKYTLGGWQTWSTPAEVEGTTVALADDLRARFTVPSVAPDRPQDIVLHVRGFARGPLSAFLDGDPIGDSTLPADGSFTTLRLAVPPGRMTRREGMLELRARRAGPVPGGGRSGLAVDSMAIGPTGAMDEAPPPAPASLEVQAGGVAGIRIPAGWTLGYSLPVPQGARLRGVVQGDGEVSVTGRLDPDRRVPLGDLRGTFDLSLGPLAGHVARIDVTAGADDMVLLHPVIVTLDRRPETELRRPHNLLIYLIDTLRADKLQPYNSRTRVRTPGLLRFLGNADVMAEAHSQENWTKPSVATLLTSLMPWQHTAIRGESVLPDTVRMLPEILGDQGFYTGSFIANGYVSDRFGFRQGWDTYRNYIREGRRTRSEYVAGDVLRWLDQRPEDRPFFLYVHTIDPHVPYRPPEEFLRLYEEPGYHGPVSFRRDATLLEKIKVGQLRLDQADRSHLEALYDAEISYHDVHFDEILQGLESRGLAEDTMVVVTADHGEEFWDHGSVGHGHSVYEELLHVPMFVRLPGVTDHPRAVDGSVGLVDVVPTVLQALGIELPGDLSGRSFLDRLQGQDESAPPVAVSGFMEHWRTAVVADRKLVQQGAGRWRVFDLTRDPREQDDVADEAPVLTRYLRGQLGLTLSRTEPTPAPGEGRPRPAGAPAGHQPVNTEIDPRTREQLRALGYVQ